METYWSHEVFGVSVWRPIIFDPLPPLYRANFSGEQVTIYIYTYGWGPVAHPWTRASQQTCCRTILPGLETLSLGLRDVFCFCGQPDGRTERRHPRVRNPSLTSFVQGLRDCWSPHVTSLRFASGGGTMLGEPTVSTK